MIRKSTLQSSDQNKPTCLRRLEKTHAPRTDDSSPLLTTLPHCQRSKSLVNRVQMCACFQCHLFPIHFSASRVQSNVGEQGGTERANLLPASPSRVRLFNSLRCGLEPPGPRRPESSLFTIADRNCVGVRVNLRILICAFLRAGVSFELVPVHG